jgi:hypothetical protein
MVSQGGSRKNVTVVLRDADATEAMQRLHRRFFETGPTLSGGERSALAPAERRVEPDSTGRNDEGIENARCSSLQ